MASLSPLDAVNDAFGRLNDRRAATALGSVFLIQLCMLVGLQSQLEAQRSMLEEESLPFAATTESLPEELPLALDIPVGVSMLLWLSMLVAFVAASVVAFRVLVDQPLSVDGPTRESTPRDETPQATVRHDSSDSAAIEPPAWNENLLRTTVLAGVTALIGAVLVGLGLLALVLPGLVVATALAFTHPYLVTTSSGILESMKRSYELVRGTWLTVFGLIVVILLSFVTISSLGAFAFAALESLPAAGELANLAFGSLAWLYALALLASGFDQVTQTQAAEAEKWADIDQELLP